MIENIIKILDQNKNIVIVIIVLIVLTYVYIKNNFEYSCMTTKPNKSIELIESIGPNKIEKFDIVKKTKQFDSKKFNELFVSDNVSKGINLKCKIDNIEYYLSNIDVNPESMTRNLNSLQKDCPTSALILVPATEIKENLDQYLKSLSKASKLCALDRKTTCLENLKDPNLPTAEELIECDVIPESCKYNRYFTHDFKIREVTNNDDECSLKKYLFYGVKNVPQPGSSAPQSLINHELYYDAKPYPIPIVCSDYYPYGAKNKMNEWGEIYVSETFEESTGIIGLSPKLKIKLAFKSQIVLPGKDSNGNIIYTPCFGCNPNYTYSYIGYCKESDNLDYETPNKKKYKRICIIPANLIGTPEESRILEFEPVLIK